MVNILGFTAHEPLLQLLNFATIQLLKYKTKAACKRMSRAVCQYIFIYEKQAIGPDLAHRL